MSSNQSLKNVHQNDVEAVQRGYELSAAKLPPIKRGAKIAPDISQSWFAGIEETAGDHASDRVLQRAKYGHKTLVDSITLFEQLREKRNPSDSPATHLQKVDKAGKQLLDAMDKQFTSIRQDINHRRNEIKSDIKTRLGLDTTNSQTNEIRSIIRGMSEKDRVSALMKAVEEGDKVILSAIWDSHEIALGVKADLLQSLKQSAMNKHASDLVSFNQALDRSEDLLLESYFDTAELTKNAVDGDAIAKFRQEAEKADLATAGFTNLLRGDSQ